MEKLKEELMRKATEVLTVLKPLIILGIVYIVLQIISFLMVTPIVFANLQK
jgi:hypothetical protein